MAGQLGPTFARLRHLLKEYRLELRTVPEPAIAPCLLWIVDQKGTPQRLRKVVRRSSTVRTYRELSAKTGENVECEGDNEHHAFQHLDTDPDVREIWDQTPVLLYESGGKLCKYAPDSSLRTMLREASSMRLSRELLTSRLPPSEAGSARLRHTRWHRWRRRKRSWTLSGLSTRCLDSISEFGQPRNSSSNPDSTTPMNFIAIALASSHSGPASP